MLENILKIILAPIIVYLFVIYPIAVFNSYKYAKKNLKSIAYLFFGDPKYYKELDWANHLVIEMSIGAIAALRFRELKILKRDTIFSKGHLPLAPNLDDKNLNLLLRDHGQWYNLVVKNLMISSLCLIVATVIFFILK